MKKLGYIEAIRGLAALIVVFTHFAAVFYPSAIFGNSYPAHSHWEVYFTTTPLGFIFSGQFAVCLFFILSGYVLSLSFFGQNSKDRIYLLAAIVKRPVRLGGMVLFSELMSWCLFRWGCYYNEEASLATISRPWFQQYWKEVPVGVSRLAMDMFTRPFEVGEHYNAPLWTIKIELYCSFMTFIFLLLFRNSSFRLLAYLLAAVCYHNEYFQGFLVGIALADFMTNYSHGCQKWFRSQIAIPMLLLGFLFASYPAYAARADLSASFYTLFPKLPGLAGGFSMLGALLVFVSVLLSAKLQRVLVIPFFVFFGRLSYPIYALHFILIGSFSSWMFLNVPSELSYDAKVALTVLASFGGLLVLSYYAEKYVDIPFTKLAKKAGDLWMRSLVPEPIVRLKKT